MLRKTVVEIVILTAIGAVLAFIGPFGSFALPLTTRLLYWIALLLIGFPLFRASGTLARWLAQTSHVPEALATLVTIALAAVPMTFIVALFFYWNFVLPARVDWTEVGEIFLQVWIIAALVVGSVRLIFAAPQDAQDLPLGAEGSSPSLQSGTPTKYVAPPPPPSFHRLDLPPGFGPVLALQSEDHYVRVHGERRSHLILIRLRDAITLMPVDAGLQVHRSWWVAKDAVVQSRREGRSALLFLADGTAIPVSRDNIATARAAGLLT